MWKISHSQRGAHFHRLKNRKWKKTRTTMYVINTGLASSRNPSLKMNNCQVTHLKLAPMF